MAPFLIEIASQGITVISNGAAELNNSKLTYNSLRTYPQSKREDMKIALDWAERQAANPNYSHFDLSRVAAGGQSCGGFETSVMSTDPRVKALGFFQFWEL
jgi:dienelactone hydrolase